jgi:hypothetical protein
MLQVGATGLEEEEEGEEEGEEVFCIKGTVYNWLFVRAIRRRWLYISTSTNHSITCRIKINRGAEQGKLIA